MAVKERAPAPPYEQRVACVECSMHRMHPGLACPTCGSSEWKAVKPGPADLQAIYWEILDAAEALDHLIQAGGRIDRCHPAADALRQACRAHALAKVGVLVR